MLKHTKIIFAFVITVLVIPRFVFADYGYLTMPVDPSTLSYSGANVGINSWVDHTSPLGGVDTSTVMTRYDGAVFRTSTSLAACTNGVQCYSGHEGIDYAVASGTQVLAAASGTVKQAEWHDPGNHNFGFGLFSRIWHNQYGISTLYAHLSTTTISASTTVTRGQSIAKSGGTGDALGAFHLHFQVYNADATVTSTNAQFSHSVDPYGWSGPGGQASDTWTNDVPFGYMWIS